MGASKVQYEKVCPVCGNRFKAKTLYSVYCGTRCSRNARKLKEREEYLETERQQRIDEMSLSDYIPVSQAVDLYQISKCTFYRLIKSGRLQALEFGPHLTRIRKTDIENLTKDRFITGKVIAEEPRLYSYRFDGTDCYTISEINEKFALHETTIWSAIRRKGIPICYRGNYAFVPKDLIDELFSNKKTR
ncbi:MAG: helix-turn-helix domain-containing protein [Bacteroidaceae bacterium]|nr:helix-turn-helix domain-containing protein [Bacteroidaceae bacterium]